MAWSLNLHHPYDPYNPIDSLEVAARAINNIIGGASLTGSTASPAFSPGWRAIRQLRPVHRIGGGLTRAGFPDIAPPR